MKTLEKELEERSQTALQLLESQWPDMGFFKVEWINQMKLNRKGDRKNKYICRTYYISNFLKIPGILESDSTNFEKAFEKLYKYLDK